MITEVIHLNDYFPRVAARGNDPTLTAYIPDGTPDIEADRRRPSIIVCPGGGYTFVSDREGEPVALAFAARGYNAFVLKYSVTPAHYPTQLAEAAAAAAMVRRNAENWHVDTNAVIACGFSAGGHVAACLGILGAREATLEAAGVRAEECKLNGMILGYAVLTSGEFAHRDSFINLLGEKATEEELRAVSLELQVDENTPPAFLWHTASDDLVPVMNSVLLAQSLNLHEVPFEMHVFDKGVHGLALCNWVTAGPSRPFHVNPFAEKWLDLCESWVKRNYIS